MRFPYEWRMSDGYPAAGIEEHGCTVFDTFVCGGGSSMGFKLAGYRHLGGVELDPKIASVYAENHRPRHFYVMDVRDFNKLGDLPDELYHLDLLSGSPPCSTFSRAGDRDRDWGRERRFDEGQKLQVLDDLVFVFCDTIEKLRPKCFIMENVRGIIETNARSYTRRLVERMGGMGYDVQVFCLNAATMGVPQSRERVFFVGHRKEYLLPRLVLDFSEKPIPFGDIMERDVTRCELTPYQMSLWMQRRPTDMRFGDIAKRVLGKTTMFNCQIHHRDRVLQTIHTSSPMNATYDYPRGLTEREILLGSTFPLDYKYKSRNKLYFYCGMSVPPVMMAQISYEIYLQWLKKIK